ncbi:MAG: hypothetical protein RIG26_14945 [Thalassospira sp.]|uniref:hypothetical protein n=1 Tax=Thalassospira sp. TaxID=1912094 RepID=UPI0032EFBA62
MNIRKEVMAHFVEIAENAEKSGLGGLDVLRKQFPDVPVSILAEAATEAWMNADEAWWQKVEKTIDDEIIKKALEGKGEPA